MILKINRLTLQFLTVVLVGVATSAVAPCHAQEQDPAAEQDEFPPPVERAREAFREALERIWVPQYRLTNGPHVHRVFREVVGAASKATVSVRSGGKQVALGGIIGPDGWILTKASQLKGNPTVVLKDQRQFDARTVGVDREHDLAILKVEAKDLPVLEMDAEVTAEEGSWVVTVGTKADPVAVGVMSVSARRIAHRAGILGIQLDDVRRRPAESDQPDEAAEPPLRGALVVKVFANTGAERAGILVNDVITSVNGTLTSSRLALINEVRRYSPGDEVEIGLTRGDKKFVLVAILTGRVKEWGTPTRSQIQNSLGSKLSQRRFGFPIALQHDTVLKPTDCGGPLVNVEGQVIGFNIARAGRTESYAIPTATILPLMYELMSGKQAPEAP